MGVLIADAIWSLLARSESGRNNILPGIRQRKLRRASFRSERKGFADSISVLSLLSATENQQSADC